MKHTHTHRIMALSTLGLAFLLASAAHAATAQETASNPAAPAARAIPVETTPAQNEPRPQTAPPAEYEPVRLQVGDATQSLFAWQRSGELASTTPRPIPGDVANRSYERYLKSFEFPIPERMTSTVKSSNSNSNSSVTK
ncbi:DUF3613 domain-containing protein [Variovorax sp. EL159]|uniref:DUF3613 domain-containing protein n=1 Tax=Variovorax sp. EL159 TaxID=1566270 RepID=UPI00088ECB1F|nr:DUF3613 domain-containing protein [Variovorax sp. EL159]SCX74048.1 Protein of unknown function [Variovorax sp. EL159]